MSKEPRQRVLLHGLDRAPEFGQRFAANQTQHLRVAPLTMQPPGAEATPQATPFGGEQTQHIFDLWGIQGEAVDNLAQSEWTMSARVAANQFENRLRYRFHQGR